MALGDSHNGSDALIVVGYALIGFGGIGVLFSSLQLAQLYAASPLFIGLIVAAYSFSGKRMYIAMQY